MVKIKEFITGLVVVLVMIATVYANVDEKSSDNSNNENNVNLVDNNSTDVVEGRRRHHLFGFHPFHMLWGFGGAHAIAIALAVKAKIVLVTVLLIASFLYYTKVLTIGKSAGGGGGGGGGGCDHPNEYREGAIIPIEHDHSFSYHPPSGYSSHADISSYNGPDPYSAYSSLHSEHFDHSDHHFSGDVQFDPSHYDSSQFDSSEHYDHHDHHDQSSELLSGGAPSVTPPSSTYKRGFSESNNNVMMNWGELAFNFLGVDTDGCRRRFVCELDMRVKQNMMTRMLYSLVNRNLFDRYRNLNDSQEKADSFGDCARIFNDCRDAEKYNRPHRNDEEETDDEQEQEEQNDSDVDDENSTATDEPTETPQDDSDANDNDISQNEARRRVRSIGHFMFRQSQRADTSN